MLVSGARTIWQAPWMTIISQPATIGLALTFGSTAA